MLAALALLPAAAGAQAPAPKWDPSETARQFQNPLPDEMNLKFLHDVELGVGPEGEDSQLTVRVNALLPMRLTSSLNLVVNTIARWHSRPGLEVSDERINGLGDVLQHLLLGPTRAGRFLYAVGPALELPSASRNVLGSGRVSVGPSVVASYQSPSWTLAFNGWHLRSVTGREELPKVEETHVVPTVSHSLPSGVVVGIGSDAILNWSAPAAERTTLPLVLTMSRVTRIEDQEVDLSLAGRYYLDAPTTGPEWGLRLAVGFTFDIDRDEL